MTILEQLSDIAYQLKDLEAQREDLILTYNYLWEGYVAEQRAIDREAITHTPPSTQEQ